MSKNILASKVFWVNFVTIVVAVASAYGVTPDPELSEKVAASMVLASPVINIVLRYFTKKPVTLLPSEIES